MRAERTGAGPVPEIVTDPGDPRLDDYRHLNDGRLRRRLEAPDPVAGSPGFFVAEGVHAVRRLLRSECHVRSLLVDPARHEALATTLTARSGAGPGSAGASAPPAVAVFPVFVADQRVLDAVAGFPVHRGALASASRFPLPGLADLLDGARRVAVLEGVNDHENLGVVFRSAAGLGLDAVLLCPRTCDPLYRRSVRVSMGHVLTVPWARLGPWPDALDDLRGAGFSLLALTPSADAHPLGALRPADGERIAVLLGAEGPGLSPEALARADRRIAIPMAPGADSLNLASAASIAFYALGDASAAGGPGDAGGPGSASAAGGPGSASAAGGPGSASAAGGPESLPAAT